MRIFNKKYGELVAHTPDAHLNATIDAHDDVAFVGNYITAAGEVVRRPVALLRALCEGDAQRGRCWQTAPEGQAAPDGPVPPDPLAD